MLYFYNKFQLLSGNGDQVTEKKSKKSDKIACLLMKTPVGYTI